MRNSLMLFSLVAAVAACSDQQQPTSPVTTKGGGTVAPASATSAALLNGSLGAPAKPTDQVGFTQVFDVVGDAVTLVQGNVTVAAVCPAGSQPVSGSYTIPSFYAPSVFIYSSIRSTNRWLLSVYIPQAGVTTTIVPIVTCIK